MVERVALADLHTVVAGQRWYARVAHGGGARGESPVLLVHGFGISSSYFVPAARRLGAIFDVYAPDLPGHGKSDTPPRALDVPALASALREWCAAVGIERARVVANSMGCQTAAELALREPDFVERLVLIGPTVDTAARNPLALAWRLAAGGVHERWSMTRLLVRDYLRMGPRAFAELGFMLADRIEEKLPRMRMPVLLVRGQHDRVAPQRWIDALARITPNARVVVIADGAHAAHYGKADDLVRAIAPFLRAERQCRPAPAGSVRVSTPRRCSGSSDRARR